MQRRGVAEGYSRRRDSRMAAHHRRAPSISCKPGERLYENELASTSDVDEESEVPMIGGGGAEGDAKSSGVHSRLDAHFLVETVGDLPRWRR